MPDTDPALDDPALVEFVIRRGETTGSLTLSELREAALRKHAGWRDAVQRTLSNR